MLLFTWGWEDHKKDKTRNFPQPAWNVFLNRYFPGDSVGLAVRQTAVHYGAVRNNEGLLRGAKVWKDSMSM